GGPCVHVATSAAGTARTCSGAGLTCRMHGPSRLDGTPDVNGRNMRSESDKVTVSVRKPPEPNIMDSADPVPGWRFDNSYARLPPAFLAKQDATPVREPRLVLLNGDLCRRLGLDAE